MNGIAVKAEPNGPVLVWERCDDIVPRADEVVIATKAAGVNRADLLQAAGKYPPPAGASNILGLEVSGEIAAVGAAVNGWKRGDRVMALLAGGGYAEFVAVPVGQLIPIPDSLSFVEAAAIPEAFITAYLNLFIEGRFQSGEAALIHAGASGVGAAAIQLVSAFGGQAFCTVGSHEKAEFCRSLGAQLAVNYRDTSDFVPPIMDATAGKGVDVVLDCVGGKYLQPNIRVLAPKGRMVTIGMLGGRTGELDLGLLLEKMLELKGSKLRVRPASEKAELTSRFRQQLLPLFESGRLRPNIDEVFQVQEASAAHRKMALNLNLGKIVLKVSD